MKSLVAITTLLCAMLYLAASDANERRLGHALKLRTDVRPVASTDSKVNVTFGLTLVEAFPEKEYRNSFLMRFKTWHQYSWKDETLRWDPKLFGGVTMIHTLMSSIWHPDIKLFNSATATDEQDMTSLAIVYSDGTVLWVPQTMAVLSCPKKHDIIKCQLKYGSWTYSGDHMDLHFTDKAKADVSHWSGLEYDVVKNKAARNVDHYDCCPEPYINLTYDIHLKLAK